MGGMGGGMIYNVGRDIAVDGTAIVNLQPTDEYLRITSATPAPGSKIAGFRPTALFTIQDRVFILTNLSGTTVSLGDQSFLDGTPSTADQEDQIRVNSGISLSNLHTVFLHYHIGTLGWYILGR